MTVLSTARYRSFELLSPKQQAQAEAATCVMSNRYRSGGPVAEDFERGLRMAESGLQVEVAVPRDARLSSWSLDERRVRFCCSSSCV